MFAAIEVIRMVAAVAEDPVHGVNARIADLLLDGADPRPPLLKAILNEADHNTTIGNKPDAGWPIGVVIDDDEGIRDVTPEAVVGYRRMTVGIAFVLIIDNAGGPAQWRAAKYTLQAFVNSMEKGLLAPGRLEVAGKRNNVQILQAIALDAPNVEVALGQSRSNDVVRYRFEVEHQNL